MSTALLFQYLPSGGFVIAADGRSTKEDTLEVASDSVQKIFQIGGPGRRLAYAMTGALKLESPLGEVAVDLAYQMTNAVGALSTRKFADILFFTSQLCDPIYRALRDANKAGRIARLPRVPQPEKSGESGETIIRVVIAGYFNEFPSLVEARIAHQDGIVNKPTIIGQPLDGTWRSGVPEVSKLFLDETDSTFAAYRPFIPKDRNPTIHEVVEIARKYIAACGSEEAMRINPAAAKGIGGKTLIATITEDAGFRWADGYEPDPLAV